MGPEILFRHAFRAIAISRAVSLPSGDMEKRGEVLPLMPFKPSEPGEFPTLGHDVAEWMTYYLAQPDRASYEPFRPYDEQYEFLLRFYELDPHTGKRKIQRGLLGRPRGWG